MKINSLSLLTKILCVFCFFCFSTQNILAQNWRTIIPNDTTYYYIVTNATNEDTMYDGYLRSINIVSSVYNANIETSILPYSTRLDALGNIDTTDGDSWLGHQYIRNSLNGEEFYYNQFDDTITIKTLAAINTTWKMSTDTNGIDYYGTVTSLDTTTIDGTIDSLKTIIIQAYSGLNPVPNYYNNFQIILSKNHGFYNTLDFYAFPNYDSMFYNIVPYTKFQFTHVRLDTSYTNVDYNNIDLIWKYTAGNEWMKVHHGIGSFAIIHDSIISSNLISPDSIEVTFYRHAFYQYYISTAPPNDTAYHTYNTITDTFGRNTYKFIINKYIYEPPLDTITWFGNINWKYISFNCNDKIVIIDTTEKHTPLQGWGSNSITYSQDFGEYNLYHFFFDGVADEYWERQTFYTKLGSCTEGTKLNFKGLSTNDIDQREDLILLYPNPASTFIQIMNPANIELKSYTIKNITGKAIASGIYTNSVDISRLSNGLYFIEFKTKSGILTKKFIKN